MLIMYFSAVVALVLLPAVFAKVQFLGVAIAGGEFGCQMDGTCPPESAQLPLSDGPAQMSHFVQDDGINVLRMPTSWQFLVNNQQGGDLDTSNFAKYDQLVQACLNTGAHCMIDVHNFARWDGEVIGQGGPTDEQFAKFWGQLAGKYATNDNIIFELMNEPHDLDVDIWAQTCQAAVTAIREAGAASQMILLPGTNFDSAATLVSSGSADALLRVTNPDGSTDNLILDIHKYLDKDNSGTHIPCSTDNVDAFTTVARYLRSKGRKGFVSETGATSDASCMTAFCAQNSFINANSDVFTGLVAWGAGSFSTSYPFTLTPSSQGGRLVDNTLMKKCLLAPWNSTSSKNGTAPLQTSSTRSPTATIASSVLVLTPTLFSTPTALLTAPFTMPTFSASRNNTRSSSATSKSNINTSNVLILTDTFTQSTITTLAIATGTPPARSGLDGLLTAQSGPFVPKSTSALTPSPTPTNGVGSAAVGGLHIWSLALLAAVSLI